MTDLIERLDAAHEWMDDPKLDALLRECRDALAEKDAEIAALRAANLALKAGVAAAGEMARRAGAR